MAKQSPLERYILVLEEVAAGNTFGLNLSELALRCQLPIPTAYRIVQGLMKAELVVPREGSKQYVLGSRLFRLLHAGTNDGWLKIASQPILDQMTETLHETVYLAQLVGKKVVSISWAAPESGLRTKVYPGDVMPAHAAASAKAILAHQPDSVMLRALAGPRIPFTAQTKTDLVQLQKEHARIRKDGFSTCWNEMELGLGAIACPIDVDGVGVQYAVAVTGLAARLKERSVEDTVSILRNGAEQLKWAIENGVRDAATSEPSRVSLRNAVSVRSGSEPRARKPNGAMRVIK